MPEALNGTQVELEKVRRVSFVNKIQSLSIANPLLIQDIVNSSSAIRFFNAELFKITKRQ